MKIVLSIIAVVLGIILWFCLDAFKYPVIVLVISLVMIVFGGIPLLRKAFDNK